MTTRNTVGMRKDRGWYPLIVLCIVGFIMGAGVVFVVAIHEMWLGGPFRHYALSLYWTAGLFGAVFALVFGLIICWCFDVIEEEYLDPKEEEKVSVWLGPIRRKKKQEPVAEKEEENEK